MAQMSAKWLRARICTKSLLVRRILTTVVPSVLAASIAACNDAGWNLSGPSLHLDPSYLTGAAAMALGRDGRFTMADSLVNPPGQLGRDDARAVATQYVRDVAPFMVGEWSYRYGAPVDPSALVPCGAYYTTSPYMAMTGDLSELTVRTFGPHWIVPMCPRGHQVQVVVTFSALAVELVPVPKPGEPNAYAGADIHGFGISSSAASDLYSPEAAAAAAFAATGRRISRVPELMMPPRPEVPALARWRIELESPVSVKGRMSGRTRSRSQLYVGFGSSFSESGLLDRNPDAPPTSVSWTDPVTKSEVSVVVSPLAPHGLELVTREEQ